MCYASIFDWNSETQKTPAFLSILPKPHKFQTRIKKLVDSPKSGTNKLYRNYENVSVYFSNNSGDGNTFIDS